MTASRLPRSAGILLHVSSLPGAFGIGDLGPASWRFVELLNRSGQTWWQMLPLGPPAVGGCPYQCFSAMAGDPNLISPEIMREDGLIDTGDFAESDFSSSHVDFSRVTAFKQTLIVRAWERFTGGHAPNLKLDFDQFRAAESSWLADFSLFMALKAVHGNRPWSQWPRDLAFRKPAALRAARKKLADSIGRHEFAQFLFFRQLAALRKHAAGLGVKLIGDLPMFVAGESADVWSNPSQFQLDSDRRPKFVAGVPPDYFCESGQRWGNPLYRWSAMKRNDYRWWVDRAAMALRQADLVRIDHFRGFSACWSIPATEPTAEQGTWVKSPGRALLKVFAREFGKLPFIAEDLGLITPDVEKLRDDFHLPGMRVLQFAFVGDSTHPFLPSNYIRDCVAYTGTHDNDTTVGWYKSLDSKTRRHVNQYVPYAARNAAGALMRLAWSSVANIAIAPLQDVLALGSESRMNLPGTSEGNWAWRVDPNMLRNTRFEHLRELTTLFGRQNKVPPKSPSAESQPEPRRRNR